MGTAGQHCYSKNRWLSEARVGRWNEISDDYRHVLIV